MKKSLICLCALVLLSLGGLGLAHRQLSDSAKALSFREHCLEGDLSAADGLSVELHADLDHRLFWDTTFIPGEEAGAEFRFHAKQQPRPTYRSGYFELYSPNNLTASSNSFELDEETSIWLLEPLKELADRTAPGTTGTATITLSDYVDTYPLSIDLTTPADSIHWSDLPSHSFMDGPPTGVLKTLADAFRFPIPEGSQQTLSITKEETGLITELSYSPVEGSGVSISSTSFASEDWLYFIVDARLDSDGSLLDYSRTPGGYGIYALPKQKELEPEDLRFVCPLPADVQVHAPTYDPLYDQMIYLTEADGASTLHVLDLSTCREVQQLPLGPEDLGWWAPLLQDDLLLIRYDQSAQLFQRDEDGFYVHQFDLTIPDEALFRFLSDGPTTIFYDGDRLVILSPLRSIEAFPFTNFINTSFGLMIFGEEGTRYIGLFVNGLDAGYTGFHSSADRCALSEGDALRLHETEGGPPHA